MKLHSLHRFRYCPACGSSHFEDHDFKSRRCRDCGFTYYLNASAAVVGVVVNHRNELLVGRRALEPVKGTLDLPGGFVDAGETLEQAVVRELQEETGTSVALDKYLFSLSNVYSFSGMEIPTTDSFFLCRMSDTSALRAADDVAELQWIPLSELQPDAFGLQSIRKSIPLLQTMQLE